MSKLNQILENSRQHTEGFYPSLFQIEYNFEGLGEIPKILKNLTNSISISEYSSKMGLKFLDNKIKLKIQIDTSSQEFKQLFSFLLTSRSLRIDPSPVLGTITIYYYNKKGAIFYKRILTDVKLCNDDNQYDIFNDLDYSCDSIINDLEISFTYDKISHEI